MRVAVDLMGGDNNSLEAIQACFNVVSKFKLVRLILIGNSYNQIKSQKFKHQNITFVKVDDEVTMDCSPKLAISNAKSSMYVALRLLEEDKADAVISSGNTGALVTLSKKIIGTKSVSKIGIFSQIPNINTKCYALDLGANLEISPDELVSLGLLAVDYLKINLQINNPVVKVLNIGSEDSKGTKFMQELNLKCKKHPDLKSIYKGFIEADGFFTGDANLILCKGVHGNIAIKSAEGLSRLIKYRLTKNISKLSFRGLLSLIAAPFIKFFLNDIKPENYSGAKLIGLKKTVFKTHGNSNIKAWENAIIKIINTKNSF
jgi:glycerol-3-phosphate acyltransferase PlsX